MSKSRKPRKPESRKPSKKKLQKMEERRKAQERMQQLLKEAQAYSRPLAKSEAEIEACKQRVKEGKLCYCKDVCECRECQAKTKEEGGELCTLENLKQEGGCALGCSKCSECSPCY